MDSVGKQTPSVTTQLTQQTQLSQTDVNEFDGRSFNCPRSLKTIKGEGKKNSPFHLSVKSAAAHRLLSDWRQKPGSHCTCWATALWSFPHRSLSVSPGTQQPQPTAVQQPLSQQALQHPKPSLISSPVHSFSWKVTVSGYTYCGVSTKGFHQLCVPLYRKQISSKAGQHTLITAWGLKPLQPISLWVASWEDSVALRLIFTEQTQRQTKWKRGDWEQR